MAETPLTVFEIATIAVLAVFFVVDLFIIGRKPHVPSTANACSISRSSWSWR